MNRRPLILSEHSPVGEFFTYTIGRRSVVLFLSRKPMAEPYLSVEPLIKLPAIVTYYIRAGSVDGVSVGYAFDSALARRVSPSYTIFHRKDFDVGAISSWDVSYRYRIPGGISAFSMDDSVTMLSAETGGKLIEVLEGT